MNNQNPEHKEGISDWIPHMDVVHWVPVVAILLAIVVGAIFWGARTVSSPKIEAEPLVTPGPSPDFMSLSLLEYAKRNLIPGPKDPWSTDRIKEARHILLSIGIDNKDYPEARRILATLPSASTLEARVRKDAAVQAAAERKRDADIERSNAPVRKAWADLYERLLLAQGMDVSTSVSGRNNTTLKITYVLMSRPVVFQLSNMADFRKGIRENGFKKVILTDGYDSTWTFDY